MKNELVVTYTEEDGKSFIDVTIPKEHDVTVREAARILCGALMVCIKGAGKNDHILMKESIDFLNEHFADYYAFSDAQLLKK